MQVTVRSKAMGGRASRRCPDCRGFGRCEDCHATGVNLHLNDAEPHCRGCHGTGRCFACAGTGLLRRTTPDVLNAPAWLRVILSLIPCSMLYGVFIARMPVHWGRGGPVLSSVVGQFFFAGICGTILYQIWKDVKPEDFKRRKDPDTMPLFGSLENRPTGTAPAGQDTHR